MFDAQASDITFDIDMVFSWVDGNDPEFQKRRAERMKDVVVGEGDDSEARFRQIDELKYALRSVYLFAPWVRRIFIVTDSPKPAWLADHPAVTFVRSEEFFTDPDALPTHNSQAVESQLQHIPGLSDLVREASGQFLIVHVKGTPANPSFKLEALPQLSDGVRDTVRSLGNRRDGRDGRDDPKRR